MSNSNLEVQKLLSEHGIKPSYQRIKILKYMMGSYDHPTCDQIYTDLVEEIPTLSKSTVYNTMNRFSDENICMVVSTTNNEARFDYIEKEHGHFICKECNRIFDFDLGDFELPKDQLEGCQIDFYNVEVKGICKDCLEKKED